MSAPEPQPAAVMVDFADLQKYPPSTNVALAKFEEAGRESVKRLERYLWGDA